MYCHQTRFLYASETQNYTIIFNEWTARQKNNFEWLDLVAPILEKKFATLILNGFMPKQIDKELF